MIFFIIILFLSPIIEMIAGIFVLGLVNTFVFQLEEQALKELYLGWMVICYVSGLILHIGFLIHRVIEDAKEAKSKET